MREFVNQKYKESKMGLDDKRNLARRSSPLKSLKRPQLVDLRKRKNAPRKANSVNNLNYKNFIGDSKSQENLINKSIPNQELNELKIHGEKRK